MTADPKQLYKVKARNGAILHWPGALYDVQFETLWELRAVSVTLIVAIPAPRFPAISFCGRDGSAPGRAPWRFASYSSGALAAFAG
jgi:hypothetical protein